MLPDAGKHITQVRFGLHTIEQAGANDGVEYRCASATRIRTCKKPIFSAYPDAAECILHGIVADLQPAILEIARQRNPARARIADCLGQIAAPGNALELLIEPSGQLIKSRFG